MRVLGPRRRGGVQRSGAVRAETRRRGPARKVGAQGAAPSNPPARLRHRRDARVPVYHPFLSSYVVPTAHAFPAVRRCRSRAGCCARTDPAGRATGFRRRSGVRARRRARALADGSARAGARAPRVDAAEGSGFDVASRRRGAHPLERLLEDDHPKAPESLSASAVASATRRAASLDPDALERDAVERQRPRIWNNQHSYRGGAALLRARRPVARMMTPASSSAPVHRGVYSRRSISTPQNRPLPA